MPPTRRGSALVTAALITMMVAGCTSGTVRSSTGKPSPTTRSGHTSTRPTGPSTSSATPTAGSVLDCGGAGVVGGVDSLQVVLGVVALPISPRYPALGTSLSGDGNGPLRLFAKTGLFFRPGTKFELIVPARFASRLRIGWGEPGYAQPDSAGQQLRQPRRRQMAGHRGRVLDRSPGLRADHRQGRRQGAAGAHRRRKGLPWPAAAARTESELATHSSRDPEGTAWAAALVGRCGSP